jgi:hypothetical protein
LTTSSVTSCIPNGELAHPFGDLRELEPFLFPFYHENVDNCGNAKKILSNHLFFLLHSIRSNPLILKRPVVRSFQTLASLIETAELNMGFGNRGHPEMRDTLQQRPKFTLRRIW